MYESRQFDVAHDCAASASEVCAANPCAVAPASARRPKGRLAVVDDRRESDLRSVARQLHTFDFAAAALPPLNGALTRRHIDALMNDLLDLLFPGLLHPRDRQRTALDATQEALEAIRAKLLLLVAAATEIDAGSLMQFDAQHIVVEFLHELPNIRRALVEDARAAYDGDPAARSVSEVVLAYPGFLALATHRLAHRLHALRVPLVPRLMSEWAHMLTGIDIHPGATLGSRTFIDHGTGVVVGETAVVGNNVRIYHGVTLGAASTRLKRPTKRHPTIQDGVTIYAHATVLGGTTVVGRNSVVGAAVVLADSLPEDHAVIAERLNIVKMRARDQRSHQVQP